MKSIWAIGLLFVQMAWADEDQCKNILDKIIAESKLGKNLESLDTLHVSKTVTGLQDLVGGYLKNTEEMKKLDRRAGELEYEISQLKMSVRQSGELPKDLQFERVFYEPQLGAEQIAVKMATKWDDSLLKKIYRQNSLARFYREGCHIDQADYQTKEKDNCRKALVEIDQLGQELKRSVNEPSQLAQKLSIGLSPRLKSLDQSHEKKFQEWFRIKKRLAELQLQKQKYLYSDQSLSINKSVEAAMDSESVGLHKVETLKTSRVLTATDRAKIEELKKENEGALIALGGAEKLKDPKMAAAIKKELNDKIKKIDEQLKQFEPKELVNIIKKGNKIVGFKFTDPINFEMWNDCRDFKLNHFADKIDKSSLSVAARAVYETVFKNSDEFKYSKYMSSTDGIAARDLRHWPSSSLMKKILLQTLDRHEAAEIQADKESMNRSRSAN